MSQSIQIYQSDDGQLELRVALDNETVWLAQDQLLMTEQQGRLRASGFTQMAGNSHRSIRREACV